MELLQELSSWLYDCGYGRCCRVLEMLLLPSGSCPQPTVHYEARPVARSQSWLSRYIGLPVSI